MDRNSRTNPQPKDLLNLAIQAQTGAETGAGTADNVEPALMDPERREWLETVMQSVFGQNMDPVKQMKSCLAVLTSVESDDEHKDAAFDVLESLTESMDISNDLHKIGGFSVLQTFLVGPNEHFRSRSAMIYAQMLQNNPYCQGKAIEEGFLPVLLKQMEKENISSTKIKILSALSSFLRSSPESQTEFEKLDGFSVLLRCMISSKNAKFQTSAAFLLSRICSQNDVFCENLAKMGFVHHFVALLQKTNEQKNNDQKNKDEQKTNEEKNNEQKNDEQKNDEQKNDEQKTDEQKNDEQKNELEAQLREHLTGALATVLEHSAYARKEAALNRLNLVPYLEERMKEIGNQEEFLEESEYINQILQLLKKDKKH